jgi:hypothetical protein
MVFSTFMIICLWLFLALLLFTKISGDLLANTKWDIISDASFYLSIALLIFGAYMIYAVASKSATAPDNEIICTYRLQDLGTLTPSSSGIKTDKIFLIDENNNTLTISTWANEVQYIADHKYPLVEKIRVKTFFIYRELFLVHL